jgi:hypothetical protein
MDKAVDWVRDFGIDLELLRESEDESALDPARNVPHPKLETDLLPRKKAVKFPEEDKQGAP